MPRFPILPTNRFWVPLDSEPLDAFPMALDSEDQAWYRYVVRPAAKPLADLADAPCLFLLGEPGLGKSTAVKQEVDRLEADPPRRHDVFLIDLAVVSSGTDLDDELRHSKLDAWARGSGVLHLFLDSYDECLRRDPALKPRLLRHLVDLPLDRLRLRIACRSGEFPGNLPDDVRDLWRKGATPSGDSVHLVQLEPLGRWDIRAWADAAGIDSEAFLQTIDERNARAFAGRPITLRTLITHFSQNRWPTTEVDLFAAACQDLSDEPNLDRVANAALTIEQRVAVSERIAALTLLANTTAIWLGRAAEQPKSALSIDDLVGGSEDVAGTRVDVSRRSVEDVLHGSALFEAQDYALIRWSQRTYQEFLAARYFARRLHDTTTALQFFEHPGRPGATARYIAPQLTEVAAWLAAMDAGVARWVADHDPGVLLRTRHHIFPTLRPHLASWLLSEERIGRTVDLRRRGEEVRTALDHPGVCDDLESLVVDREADPDGRSLACQLAAVCRCESLEGALLAIAVQADEPPVVRRSAVSALGEIGSGNVKAQLLPLLDLEEPSSDLQRLQVEVLIAVWPQHRSTSALLDFLLALQGNNDAVTATRARHIVDRMGRREVLDALKWIETRASWPEGNLDYLLGQIMARAASDLDDEEIRAALVRTVSSRLDAVQSVAPGSESSLIEEIIKQPDQVRLVFVDALVQAKPHQADLLVRELIVQLDLPPTKFSNGRWAMTAI